MDSLKQINSDELCSNLTIFDDFFNTGITVSSSGSIMYSQTPFGPNIGIEKKNLISLYPDNNLSGLNICSVPPNIIPLNKNENFASMLLGNETNFSTHLGKNIYPTNKSILSTTIGANSERDRINSISNSTIIGIDVPLGQKNVNVKNSTIIGISNYIIESSEIDNTIVIGNYNSFDNNSICIGTSNTASSSSIAIGNTINSSQNCINIGNNIQISDSFCVIGNPEGPNIKFTQSQHNSDRIIELDGPLHIGGEFINGQHVTHSSIGETPLTPNNFFYSGNRLLMNFRNSDSQLQPGEMILTRFSNKQNKDGIDDMVDDFTAPSYSMISVPNEDDMPSYEPYPKLNYRYMKHFITYADINSSYALVINNRNNSSTFSHFIDLEPF